MAQNEMRAKCGPPVEVRSMEGLGVGIAEHPEYMNCSLLSGDPRHLVERATTKTIPVYDSCVNIQSLGKRLVAFRVVCVYVFPWRQDEHRGVKWVGSEHCR